MHTDLARTARLGQAQKREDMLLVAVHAAGREQTHDMQAMAAGFGGGDGGQQLGILAETSVLDGSIDPGQILINDTAGTDVHMTDFGIAHLAIWQTDETALGMDQGIRAFGQQAPPCR